MFEDISETYNYLTKESEDIKEDIIKTKLNLLFNYTSEEETVSKFDELRENINLLKKLLWNYKKSLIILYLVKETQKGLLKLDRICIDINVH